MVNSLCFEPKEKKVLNFNHVLFNYNAKSDF